MTKGFSGAAARSGFSLVELSIVLVILGLLTGGILTGQHLIHAAGLRSFSTDYSLYRTAFETFRQKYFGLPGDFKDASLFWGDDCNGNETGTDTCSGDGNGAIGGDEQFTLWKHLNESGVLTNSMTGVPGDPQIYEPGINVPKSDAWPSAKYSILNSEDEIWKQKVHNYSN